MNMAIGTVQTNLERELLSTMAAMSAAAMDFENLLCQEESTMAGSSAGETPASAAASGPTAAPTEAPSRSTDLSGQDTEALMNGDYFSQNPQDSKATCPPDVPMSKLMSADGGLLDKMGNQNLKGEGAQGISGGIKDNLARLAGGQPGDIGKNKDVTMRALMIAESCKNVPGSNGKMLPASIRHNGNMSGLDPSGKVMNGSDLSFLQNMFKDPKYQIPPQRPTDMGMNGNDTEKSGGHKFWNEDEKYILPILTAPLALIPGVGDELEGDVIAGDAGDAAADAASAGRAAGTTGRAAGAAGSSAAKPTASSIMSQLAKQSAEEMAKEGAKEGGKAAWNQIQNQLPQGGSPNGTAQSSPSIPISLSA